MEPLPVVNTVLFKQYMIEFSFRREYFIGEWLERVGFDVIVEKVVNPGDELYIEKNVNKFVRSKVLEKIFEMSKSHN